MLRIDFDVGASYLGLFVRNLAIIPISVATTSLLSTHQLHCQPGAQPLFTGLTLAVAPGEVLHVAGHNGAGKTSLLRMLAGLATPAAGEVRWQGQRIQDGYDAYRATLQYVAHQPAVKAGLTPLENLALAVSMAGYRSSRAQRVSALETVGMAGAAQQLCERLSAGQKRRVALARLLVRPASIWLLDEPLTALDAAGKRLVTDLIGQQVARGGAVVFSSHQALAWPDTLPVKRLVLGETQQDQASTLQRAAGAAEAAQECVA